MDPETIQMIDLVDKGIKIIIALFQYLFKKLED